jgi:hypothetical protein
MGQLGPEYAVTVRVVEFPITRFNRALATESGVSSAFTGMSALQSPSGELGPARVFHSAVDSGAGTRPNCSSIESRSNIKLNETCLPSRKRSTWM